MGLLQQDAALADRWQALPRRDWRPGQALVRAGDPAAAAWWVERGLVRLYFLGPDGSERNRSFHVEGAWVGGGMPPHVAPSPFTIEALEPTTAVELAYAELQAVQQQFPVLQAVLAEALAWTFRQQAARESELLMLDGTQRYLRFVTQEPQLAARVPLHHVASYLGITNVALSRIRRRLGLGDARRRRPSNSVGRP